jgi:hypothetical protein
MTPRAHKVLHHLRLGVPQVRSGVTPHNLPDDTHTHRMVNFHDPNVIMLDYCAYHAWLVSLSSSNITLGPFSTVALAKLCHALGGLYM